MVGWESRGSWVYGLNHQIGIPQRSIPAGFLHHFQEIEVGNTTGRDSGLGQLDGSRSLMRQAVTGVHWFPNTVTACLHSADKVGHDWST